MTETFYLDESGSSGDLVNSGTSFEFSKQPVFVLTCVGVDDQEDLEREITRLKSIHRVKSKELKSTAVKDKPDFVVDITSYIEKRSLPIFVEVVDKRFFICAMIVNHVALPAIGPCDLEPRALWTRNIFAEYLHANMADTIMQVFVDACEMPTNKSAQRVYDALLEWLSSCSSHDEIAGGIYLFARDSCSDFQELARNNFDAWRRVLPLPDYSKKRKPFWMLPNLSSFTNIYARVNLYLDGKIEKVKLLHDEQVQFDCILADGKVAVEELSGYAPSMRHANYAFLEQAHLEFARSEQCIGIQIADVLGGFVMRYVQQALYSRAPVSELSADGFGGLLRLSDPARGTGINFVMTMRDFSRMGLRAT